MHYELNSCKFSAYNAFLTAKVSSSTIYQINLSVCLSVCLSQPYFFYFSAKQCHLDHLDDPEEAEGERDEDDEEGGQGEEVGEHPRPLLTRSLVACNTETDHTELPSLTSKYV